MYKLVNLRCILKVKNKPYIWKRKTGNIPSKYEYLHWFVILNLFVKVPYSYIICTTVKTSYPSAEVCMHLGDELINCLYLNCLNIFSICVVDIFPNTSSHNTYRCYHKINIGFNITLSKTAAGVFVMWRLIKKLSNCVSTNMYCINCSVSRTNDVWLHLLQNLFCCMH